MKETIEIEEQTDSSNAICPYCGHQYQVDTEAYRDEEGEAETCDKCGNQFWRATEFDVTHRCSPIVDGQPTWSTEIEVEV